MCADTTVKHPNTHTRAHTHKHMHTAVWRTTRHRHTSTRFKTFDQWSIPYTPPSPYRPLLSKLLLQWWCRQSSSQADSHTHFRKRVFISVGCRNTFFYVSFFIQTKSKGNIYICMTPWILSRNVFDILHKCHQMKSNGLSIIQSIHLFSTLKPYICLNCTHHNVLDPLLLSVNQ